MPQVWFHKLKAIGKAHIRTSRLHSKVSQHRLVLVNRTTRQAGSSVPIYASPLHHEAPEVQAPETQCIKSPLYQAGVKLEQQSAMKVDAVSAPVDADFSSLESVGIASTSALKMETSQPRSTTDSSLACADGSKISSNRLSLSRNQGIMVSLAHTNVPGNSSVSERKVGGKNMFCLDVMELERRLKDLQGSEERRRSMRYNSPRFSVTLPSPTLEDETQESLDLLDYSLANSFGEEGRCSRKMVYEDGGFLVKGGASSRSSLNYRESISSPDIEYATVSTPVRKREVSITNSGQNRHPVIDKLDNNLLWRSSSRQDTKLKETKCHLLNSTESPDLQQLYDNLVKERKGCRSSRDLESLKSRQRTQRSFSNLGDSLMYKKTDSDLKRWIEVQKYQECHLPVQIENFESPARREFSKKYLSSESRLERQISGRFSFGHFQNELDSYSKNCSTRSRLQHRYNSCRDPDHSMIYCRSPDPGLYRLSCCKSSAKEEVASKSPENFSQYDHSKSLDGRSDQSPSQIDVEAINTADNNHGFMQSDKTGRNPQRYHEFSSVKVPHSKVLDSVAMEKRSYNPCQDFKDSMLEMILEKELHTTNDLVHLLQCYLGLNSERDHKTIVKAFSEVWSDLFGHV